MRGDASAADADWVAEACRRRGVPHRRLVADPDRTLKNGHASEGRLRRERFRQFERAVRDAGAIALYLGHQRDDLVEGIVLAALRGAGLRGLGGVARRRPLWDGGPPVVRPLLGVRAHELRDALRAKGTDWREDPTNLDVRYLRNHVRHVLLPHLRASLGPRLDDRLLRLARWARVLSRRTTRGTDALHRRLVEAAGAPLRRGTSLLLQAAAERPVPSLHAVSPTRRLLVSRDALLVVDAPSDAAAPSTLRAMVCTDRAGRAFRAVERLGPERRRRRFEQSGRLWLDADRLAPPLAWRHRRDGDRYTPLGRTSPVKLKKLWSGSGLSAGERALRWVLVDRRGILAVEGLPPATRAAIGLTTRRVMRVRFRTQEVQEKR